MMNRSGLSGQKRDRKKADHDGVSEDQSSSPNEEREVTQQGGLVGQTISFDREGKQQKKNRHHPTTASSESTTTTNSDSKPAATDSASNRQRDGSAQSSAPSDEQQSDQTRERLPDQSPVVHASTISHTTSSPAVSFQQYQFQPSLLPPPQAMAQSQPSQNQENPNNQQPAAQPDSSQSTTSQLQILQALLLQQQQQQRQQTLPQAPNTELSLIVLQAVLSMLPQLPGLSNDLMNQQLLPLLQQYIFDEQQRQEQQRQQQLALLVGLLTPQQQPHKQREEVQDYGLAQMGALQQLVGLSSPASAPVAATQTSTFGNFVHLLAAANDLAAGTVTATPAPSLPPTNAPLHAASDPTALLQALMSSNPGPTPQNAVGQDAATLTQGVVEISGSSDASMDQSNLKRPRAARDPDIGRPKDAFTNREPDGRARDLPTLLVMPSDLVELSLHQTLLRYQIEVFRAGKEDSATHTRGRNKKVELGQIGIRCRHCKVLPVSDRLRGSVYFPRSIEGFYQAAQNMNSTHLQTGECQMMGDELRQEFADLVSSRGANNTGAGRAYWVQQARILGLQNDEQGIRFYTNNDAKG